MKKEKNFLLLIIMIAFFLFIGNVRAADDENTCKPTDLSTLRSMAANVKVTYVPVTETVKFDKPNFENEATEGYRNYLDIKIYNVNTKLEVSVKASGVDKIVTSKDTGGDGAITLRQIPQNETVTYTFEIRSYENGCHTNLLRTIKLTLPRYNFYSQLGACADIPDYYLCQEYTTYKVDGATFYDKVDEYKAKLLSLEENANEEDDNTGVVSQAISSVSKYKYVIVGVFVAIGVLLTIFILKRKKSVLK
ncbi:MAG: hypothetical protein ACI4XM_02515 [Candidatus Coprovivens sp.]